MALYSFNLSVVSNAVPGSRGLAAARLLYGCGRGVILAERTGLDRMTPEALTRFAEQRERLAGKDGRVMECIILALPVEATPEQHARLVRALAERLTHGRAPWIAAIHYDRAGNPHVHLYLFDETEPRKPGQRGRSRKVIGFSKDGALEDARALWANLHNGLMDGWGYGPGSHIDHRSLADQGIARTPTLHEGPKVRAIAAKGGRPASRVRQEGGREVRWPQIDEGSTRPETNRLVRAANALAEPATQTMARTMEGTDDHERPRNPGGPGRPDGLPAALRRVGEEDARAGAAERQHGERDERADERAGAGHALTVDAVRADRRGDTGAGGANPAGARDAAAGPALVDRGGLGGGRRVPRRHDRYRRRARWLYKPQRLRALAARLRALRRDAASSVMGFMRRANWRTLAAHADRKPFIGNTPPHRGADERHAQDRARDLP
jgi:hypothetical protein